MAVMEESRSSLDRYTGETKGQVRHGKGVYIYENSFFKYEGQWNEGVKHGRGKLIMKDGGYYEGAFENGEIEGQGYRVFGVTGSTYTGQFHNGEFHGYGLWISIDGSQYEGEWVNNRREGQGILREKDGTVFEGEFHNHKMHGTGSLMSSNGDSYEGDWVNGLRHGHGLLRCTDGTVYEGQWRGGVYHGEGSMIHSSGFRYQGMWINGRPANEAVSLSLPSNIKQPIIIDQGNTFSLAVNCVDKQGNIVDDNGRLFSVTGFIDRSVIKKNTSKPSFSVLMKEEKIELPYGEVNRYELLQVKQPDLVESEEVTPRAQSHEQMLDTEEGESAQGDLQCASLSPNTITELSVVVKTSSNLGVPGGLSGPETASMYSMNHRPQLVSEQERFLSTLVTPSPVRSSDGTILFKELYIPPPPAPKLESVMSVHSNPRLVSLPRKSSSLSLSGRNSPNKSVSTSKGAHPPSVSPLKPDLLATTLASPSSSDLKKKSSTNTVSKGKKVPTTTSRSKVEKEKLLQIKREKYCAPGTYILQVNEVTSPPFLDKLLPPLFIEVKVMLPKISGRETSLDRLLNKNRSRTKQNPTHL